MLTAHLPAAYLLGRLLSRPTPRAAIIGPAILGGLIPDIDMLWFHLVDQGSIHHHFYPTHWPLFWILLCLPPLAASWAFGWTRARQAVTAFLAGTLLHLLLDSLAGPVYWLMPLGVGRVELIEVPARYGHWIVSYLLHWSMALEVAIWLLAGYLAIPRSRPRTSMAWRP